MYFFSNHYSVPITKSHSEYRLVGIAKVQGDVAGPMGVMLGLNDVLLARFAQGIPSLIAGVEVVKKRPIGLSMSRLLVVIPCLISTCNSQLVAWWYRYGDLSTKHDYFILELVGMEKSQCRSTDD